MRVLSVFQPQLRVDTQRGRITLVDTTGDRRDNERSVLLPKAAAVTGANAKGEKFVEVPTAEGAGHWVPLDAFVSTPGDDGLLYLPTYKDSPLAASAGGAMKGLLAAGPIGGLTGAVAGAATGLVKGCGKFTRLGLGATVGAVAMGVVNSALYGTGGVGIALMLGAVTGAAAVQTGDGQASVRDATYGGTAAGFAASLVTGTPLALLNGSVAAGLGARGTSKIGQTVTAALTGALLQGAQALMGGGSLPVALAVGATVGAVGTLIGPWLMQATRNLSQWGGELLRGKLAGASDATLTALGSVPFAASGAFLGATLAAVIPGLGGIVAAAGAVAGALFGAFKTHGQISTMKANRAELNEAVTPAVENAGSE